MGRFSKLAILVIVVIVALVLWQYRDFIENDLVGELQALPRYQSLLILIALVALGIVAVIPNSILFIISGAVFGIYWGLFVSTIGFLLGACGAFLIARYVAHEFIVSRMHDRLQQLNHQVSGEGWRTVAILRLVPIMPAFLINYLLGVTHVRFFAFAWASVVFIFPGIFLFTYIGSTGRAAAEASEQSDMMMQLFFAGSLLLAIIITGIVVRRRLGSTTFDVDDEPEE